MNRKDKSAHDFSILLKILPPIVARNHIDRYLGGLISRGYLENLDSRGEGPRRIKTGVCGRVGYLREDLVRWLSQRSVIEQGDSQDRSFKKQKCRVSKIRLTRHFSQNRKDTNDDGKNNI